MRGEETEGWLIYLSVSLEKVGLAELPLKATNGRSSATPGDKEGARTQKGVVPEWHLANLTLLQIRERNEVRFWNMASYFKGFEYWESAPLTPAPHPSSIAAKPIL